MAPLAAGRGMLNMDVKALALQAVERIFNRKELGAIDELVSKEVVDHSAPEGLPPGIEGYRLKVGGFVSAFPDLQLTYAQQISEGDMVAGRFTFVGTHQGTFAGIPATGKRVSVTGHDQLRFENGKIAEHWVEMDVLSLMQQLGAISF